DGIRDRNVTGVQTCALPIFVPEAIGTIFTYAFSGEAVAGGTVGAVIRFGVARGLFSNEAGLGSAPIAAAAAKTDLPGRQALVSKIGRASCRESEEDEGCECA